jgi:photosystem II stability/assembly factor-like uncharacterized protein
VDAASSEPSAQGPARRLGLLYSAIACLVVFVGAAWWSWRYAPLPDPFEPAESRTFWQCLTTPIEHNAFRRLPVITGDLHGVFALKGVDHVWAVGDGGLMLHSTDGGESWEQQVDIDWSPAASKEIEPAAEKDAFGPIRSAHAGERPSSLPPAETAEVQRLLGDLGYDPGSTDGQASAKTRAAIEQFQRDAGLPVDGELTQVLRERLAEALDSRRTNLPVSLPPDGNPGPGPLANPNPNPNPNLGPGTLATPTPSSARNLVALRAVAFADERLGVAVGDNGVVLRSTDGGQHWQAVTSGTGAGLSSVAFADGHRAVTVGKDGTVLLSTDGGERWQPKTSGTEVDLLSVAFEHRAGTCGRSRKHGARLDRRGRALGAEDEWHRGRALLGRLRERRAGVCSRRRRHRAPLDRRGRELGAEYDWHQGRAFVGHLRECPAGGGGRSLSTVLVSNGGGDRWEPKTSGTAAWLLSVAFGNAQRAVAVGDEGTVLVSNDGGEHWEPKTSGTAAWLYSVAFANAKRALAVGDGGTVLLSTDGGENWQPKASGAALLESSSRTPSGRLR